MIARRLLDRVNGVLGTNIAT